MGLLYIIGGFLFFIAVGAMWNDSKLRRLRRERQGKDFSRERFIEVFRQLGIPDEIPAAVYDCYGSQKQLKGFPFSADDTYAEILHDDPADIDEDATILVGKLGMIIVPEYVRKQYGDKPIQSLREMVLWLDWMRQHQPKSVQSVR
jgi:hypothetical protein